MVRLNNVVVDKKAKGLVDGVVAGCFPQLYTAGPNAPDQVININQTIIKIQTRKFNEKNIYV